MSESSERPAPTDQSGTDRLTEVRRLLTEATHRLLGGTIAISDDDWRGASRLPDWSRGHVASHLARNADALVRLVGWARTGEPAQMYPSDDERDRQIAAGADRSGLELQIDLDTSAGRIEEGFDSLDRPTAWAAVVEMRGGRQVPATLLPVARLGEVVLHHVDLDIGFEIDDIEPAVAAWLLEYCAFRVEGRDGFPSLELHAQDGRTTRVGPPSDQPTVVSASASQLLGWVTGRRSPLSVEGAGGLVLPPF